jgi:DNA invertase Pin-like site-specific DNA recombinase
VTPIDQRPALVAALAALREHGAGVLVVAKRDRIARDVVLTAGVERAAAQCGAAVVSAAGEGNGAAPADQFMRTVIDGAAQYERALIRARTRAALAAKRARGEAAGNAPFGFDVTVDGRLVPNERERATLAAVRELRASGLPVRAIAAELAIRGLVSARTGRAYGKSQVGRMLALCSQSEAAA